MQNKFTLKLLEFKHYHLTNVIELLKEGMLYHYIALSFSKFIYLIEGIVLLSSIFDLNPQKNCTVCTFGRVEFVSQPEYYQNSNTPNGPPKYKAARFWASFCRKRLDLNLQNIIRPTKGPLGSFQFTSPRIRDVYNGTRDNRQDSRFFLNYLIKKMFQRRSISYVSETLLTKQMIIYVQ